MGEMFKGCAILDSGATSGVSSLVAADDIQRQKRALGEPGTIRAEDSSKRFRFGDGGATQVEKKCTIPINAGILRGKTFEMNLVDKPGNTVLPLFSMAELERLKLTVNFETGHCALADKPGKWYKLPRAPNRLLMIPLTEEAVLKHCPEWITDNARRDELSAFSAQEFEAEAIKLSLIHI